MALQGGRRAAELLTRAGLVLEPRRPRHRGLAAVALMLASLAAGAGAGYLHGWQRSRVELADAVALPDPQDLRRRLGESELTLRMARARSAELERQIDALNQNLHQCREELAFFSKARDDRRP